MAPNPTYASKEVENLDSHPHKDCDKEKVSGSDICILCHIRRTVLMCHYCEHSNKEIHISVKKKEREKVK